MGRGWIARKRVTKISIITTKMDDKYNVEMPQSLTNMHVAL